MKDIPEAVNWCDHDHWTREELRALPYGGGGNILCCHRHYLVERAERRTRQRTCPPWDNLKIYAEAIEEVEAQ